MIEDVLGSDDYCLLRVGAGTYACFDCELVLSWDGPVSTLGQMVEMSDDQLEKVRLVLQHSGKWDAVHVLDGTMEDLQREVDDKLEMEKLHPLLPPEDWQEWRDIIDRASSAASRER